MIQWLPELHKTIVDGDQIALKRLLGTKCDINTKVKHPRYKEWGTPIHFAAYEGNIDAAQELLSAGADVNKKADWSELSPLHWAAEAGQDAMVTWLIRHGADVHSQDRRAWTPLHDAASSGHVATAELLIAEGADVDHQDKDGEKSLYCASTNGHADVIRLLLDVCKYANINHQNKEGMTPLYPASMKGREKVVQLLLDNGADFDHQDKYGWTPLRWAARNGHGKVVQLLLDKGADINHNAIYGWIPLHEAARNGYEMVVQLLLDSSIHRTPLNAYEKLLDKDASINYQDIYGITPLHQAASNGHEKVVQLLLDKDADVNCQDKDEWTALLEAANNGHQKVVQQLLDKGAKINHLDKGGQTPLHRAARNGHDKVVQLLLDKGADVNHQDSNEETPLHQAARNGHYKVVQLLTDKEADVNHRDKDGWTPLHHAAQQAHENVVQVLLDGGADPLKRNKSGKTVVESTDGSWYKKTVIHLVRSYVNNNKYPLNKWVKYLDDDNREVITQMISNGFDVNTKIRYLSHYKVDGLMVAAMKGHMSVLEILLNSGCDVNTQDEEQKTALMHAVIHGHTVIVRRLIDSGCNVNMKCSKGMAALMYAVEKGNVDVVNTLIVAKCDIITFDNKKRTALHLIADGGHADIVKSLVEADNEIILSQKPKVGQNLVINELRNIDKKIALMYGARQGNLNLVEIILKESEHNVNACTVFDGKTALMFACKHGHYDIVKMLLDTGKCDLSIISKNYKTALSYAWNSRNIKIYQLLKTYTRSTKALPTRKSLHQPRKTRQIFRMAKSASFSAPSDWQITSGRFQYVDELDSSVEGDNISITSIDTVLTIDKFPTYRQRKLSTLSLPSMTSSILTIDQIIFRIGQQTIKNNRGNDENMVADVTPVILAEARGDPTLLENCPPERREPSMSPTMDESYLMRRPVGVAVIINNRFFAAAGYKNRHGTQFDEANLTRSLQNCGFIVHIYNDLSAVNICHCFDHYRQIDHARFSSFFCCVMSHGCYGNILGVDGEKVPITKLTSLFTSERCPTLTDKPKTFIMVACQSNNEDLRRYPLEDLLIPLPEKHFVVSYSTLPGRSSYRCKNGTPYIKSLTENIDKYAKERCLTEILRNTNKYMSRDYDPIQDVQGKLTEMCAFPFHSLTARFVMHAPPGDDARVDHFDVTRFAVPDERVLDSKNETMCPLSMMPKSAALSDPLLNTVHNTTIDEEPSEQLTCYTDKKHFSLKELQFGSFIKVSNVNVEIFV